MQLCKGKSHGLYNWSPYKLDLVQSNKKICWHLYLSSKAADSKQVKLETSHTIMILRPMMRVLSALTHVLRPCFTLHQRQHYQNEANGAFL